MQIYRARQIHMKWTLHYATITSGFSTGSCWNLLPNKHFCRFYTCIQNQIIDKHVYVYHNPSTGIIVLIVSLQLSIVPYAAGPESWCHSMRLYIDVKLLPKSHCSLDSYFHGSQPTHENWYWPSNFNNIFDWKNLKKIYLICLLHTNILAKHKTPPKVKWSSSNIFIINKFHKLRTSTLFKVKKILIMGIEDCFFIRTANHEQLFKTYSLSMTFIYWSHMSTD
jgi:hypothetical protein